MSNIIVLDLETARSADDCQHCGKPKEAHKRPAFEICPPFEDASPIAPWTFEPIGWHNKPALGLSIGGYYDYADDRIHWFDAHNLETTIAYFVETKPLMVSFNGIQFDFPLMRGIVRHRADKMDGEVRENLMALCDYFKELAGNSYDILAEIWRADPGRKFERGLNSLDAIAQANSLGPKLSHGAQAPRDWAVGKHAEVINYCQDDILKTKALFEQTRSSAGWLLRGDGNGIGIRWINSEQNWEAPV